MLEKAIGAFNMKDAKLFLTDTMLVAENTTAAPRFQFRVTIPYNKISKVEKGGYLLKITQKNGEISKITIYRKKKRDLFYDYLSNAICADTYATHDNTKCAFCGATLQGEYCVECGQKRVEITPEEEIAPTYRCWSCGAEFENEVKFCAECGVKQDVNKLLVCIGGEIAKKNILDVCPRCHSKNIKIYRNGYDYKEGFWLRVLDVKGGGYVAGMDSNKVRCRCLDCGKDWGTDYDYRLITRQK
jgi:transposase-like protein